MRARGLEPEEVKAEADAEEIADFMSFAKEVAQTEAEKEAEQEKDVVDMDNRGDMEQMLYMNRVAKLLKHATWDETEDKSSKKRARAEFKAVVVSGDSSAASGHGTRWKALPKPKPLSAACSACSACSSPLPSSISSSCSIPSSATYCCACGRSHRGQHDAGGDVPA